MTALEVRPKPVVAHAGDRAAFARASALKRWLSQYSNSTSVGS